MDLPKRIELIEVCPRDGFQNVHDIIPFEGKVAIIKKLAEAGFQAAGGCLLRQPQSHPPDGRRQGGCGRCAGYAEGARRPHGSAGPQRPGRGDPPWSAASTN